jgi:hypothetical protein
MKLTGLMIVILLISCEKEGKNDILTDSSFYAIKNDREWITTSSWANYSLNDGKFVIVGVKRDSVYYQDEQLYIIFKTTDISKSNTVTDFYSEWNYIVGGDVISDSYLIDSSFNNLIKINSFDTLNKQIAGTFKIKLVRDKLRSDLGETMIYENGNFILNYNKIE